MASHYGYLFFVDISTGLVKNRATGIDISDVGDVTQRYSLASNGLDYVSDKKLFMTWNNVGPTL